MWPDRNNNFYTTNNRICINDGFLVKGFGWRSQTCCDRHPWMVSVGGLGVVGGRGTLQGLETPTDPDVVPEGLVDELAIVVVPLDARLALMVVRCDALAALLVDLLVDVGLGGVPAAVAGVRARARARAVARLVVAPGGSAIGIVAAVAQHALGDLEADHALVGHIPREEVHVRIVLAVQFHGFVVRQFSEEPDSNGRTLLVALGADVHDLEGADHLAHDGHARPGVECPTVLHGAIAHSGDLRVTGLDGHHRT